MLQCLKREPGFYRYLWGLTGPIALQNLITFTLGLMDTLMVSWLGNTQMAAVTTANVPVFLLISIVFGVQSCLSILVSQYWGKRDMEHISRAIGVAAMLGTGLTVVLAAVLFWAVYAAGQHVPAPLCPALRRRAGWCYGVYLVHHVLLTLVFLPFVQGHGLPLAGMFPVYLAASFVPAAVLTAMSRPVSKAVKKLA